MYARLEQERELGELVERRIERGFENLAEPDEEERALLLDGGRERMARLMREASAVGARAWMTPDGGGATRATRTHVAESDGAAMPLQATQCYGASQDRTVTRRLELTRRCVERRPGTRPSSTAFRRWTAARVEMTMTRRCDDLTGLTRCW